MTDNNTFSLRRTGLLINKYRREYAPQLLLWSLSLTAILTAIGVLCALYTKAIPSDEIITLYTSVPTELGCFTAVCILFGLLVASAAFRSMSTPRSALATLTLPASWLDHFAARWIITVPLFIAWALLSAIFADAVRVLVIWTTTGITVPLAPWGAILTGQPGPLGFTTGMLWECIFTFLFIQSFYLLGAIVWRTHNFIKTTTATWLIGLIYLLVGSGTLLYALWGIGFYSEDIRVLNLSDTAETAIEALIILFNYTLAALRFREAETIHRW